MSFIGISVTGFWFESVLSSDFFGESSLEFTDRFVRKLLGGGEGDLKRFGGLRVLEGLEGGFLDCLLGFGSSSLLDSVAHFSSFLQSLIIKQSSSNGFNEWTRSLSLIFFVGFSGGVRGKYSPSRCKLFNRYFNFTNPLFRDARKFRDGTV